MYNEIVDEGETFVTLDDSVTTENLGISVMRRVCDDNGTLESSAIKVARGKIKIKNCKIQDSYCKGIILGMDSYAEIIDTLLRDIISEGIVVRIILLNNIMRETSL